MKNQYVGDIGDYGKYALLRFLANKGVDIAINWYFTEDDGTRHGMFISYLDGGYLIQYDPELSIALKQLVQSNKRSVAAFEELGLIKNARYYSEILSDDKEARNSWHNAGMKACQGADLVYLDPDNGASERKTRKGSCKYCFPEEIADYYNSGQNVVYYCQRAHRSYGKWNEIKGMMQKYLPDCKIFVITYHKGPQRSYIFVLHKEDYRRYATLVKEFCGKWFRVFTEETSGNGVVSGGITGERFHVVNSKGIELTIEEMENGTVRMKRSDKPNETRSISIDYFMDRLS